ncbi:DUF4169 family protein [Aurantimonas marina]|uniref:DUF4169 family protein n=1 Tax=Aurantimonas marina TaxID=2780508 RepID=UPI0019D0B601|nr:DUF4169 family protein [Aurantimonas marina]
MPADVVSLRLARKRQRRGAAEREAETNRIRHGTPKALRHEARVERERESRLLNELKLDRAAPVEVEPSAPAGRTPDETGQRS